MQLTYNINPISALTPLGHLCYLLYNQGNVNKGAVIMSAKLKVSLANLAHNIRQINKQAPQASIMAVIKANAYGHGLIRMAQAMQELSVPRLAVACVEEAYELRQNNITLPIVLLSGFHHQDQLDFIRQNNIEVVLHDPWQVDMISKIPQEASIPVWLKLDSGMHRLGFEASEYKKIYQKLSLLPNKVDLLGHFSHFAALDPSKESIQSQITCFNNTTTGLKGLRSMANSMAIMHHRASHFDVVRPGLMLYGASSVSTESAPDWNVLPLSTLSSHIIAIKKLKKGDAIGYGSCYTVKKDQKVAVVAIGYGDGYPREIKNNAVVYLQGQPCKILGKVAMDMITIDIDHLEQVHIGETAELWGKHLSLEQCALQCNTVPHRLLTQLSLRIARTYHNNASQQNTIWQTEGVYDGH